MCTRAFALMASLLVTAPLCARAADASAAVAGHPLKLNGAGRQRVLFLELYDVELYLEQPTKDAWAAIAADQGKQIRLRALRDLPRSQVKAALRQGIARSVGKDDRRALEPRLQQLLAQVRDVKKGEEIRFTYIPGEGTRIEEPGRVRAVIPGKDFADALFSIWLGPNTDTPQLKRALLSGAAGQSA